jgi:hypothetical protein
MSSSVDSQWRQHRFRQLLQISAVVGLVYLGVVWLSIRHYGDNLSSLIQVGQKAPESEPHGLGRHVVVLRNSTGYDGQFFYYIADDPFLQKRTFRSPFRYQRIGYPVVVWAVSLGRRDWRPAAMVAVNIASVLVVAILSVYILGMLAPELSPWWALLCAINPSLLAAVELDLPEPLTLALALAGLLLYMRRHIVAAAIFMAAALLTREVAILMLLPLVLAEIRARAIGNTVILLLAIVPYLLWQLTLQSAFGHTGLSTSEGNFTWPFAGIRAVIAATREQSIRQAVVHQGPILALAALMLLALGVALWRLGRRYNVFDGGIAIHSVAALFAAPVIWTAYSSAARVFGGLFPLAIFAYARQRSPAMALVIGCIVLLTAFAIVRTIAITPALSYYLTP